MSRYVWYCEAIAGSNIRDEKQFPRFNTIEEAEADIRKKGGCSPVCMDDILIFDLQKNEVVKRFKEAL